MASYRPTRVGDLLQAEIADLLLRHLKDPRLSMATVSRVDVTPDLRHACVYISRVGSETEQQATMAGFLRAAGFIRSQLGKRLRLRYAPELTFKLDTSIAYGVRMSRLLHDLTTSSDEGTESDTSHA
jgi:ribosome-binding factor A